MIFSDLVGIIADDLTGANDTALQFQQQGANTKILLDMDSIPKVKAGTEVWALSTESRNIPSGDAVINVGKAVKVFTDNFAFDYYYKKIDSTLRGNIAMETLAMLDILQYDAAIVIPAFPQEGRITVGGYHLAKGVPIGRTEMAIDPKAPITESHVPTLLRSQIFEMLGDVVGTIDLKTILNGAGPILMRINELIEEGKLLIVADATTLTDIEQIALAVKKCEKKILPTGTAAGAQIFAKYWLAGVEQEESEVHTGKLPKFIVSGTATQITARQIVKLEKSEDYKNIKFIALKTKDILAGVSDELVENVITNLQNNGTVCVHTSNLVANFDGFSDVSLNAELTKEKFASLITDFLGELTKRVTDKINVILVTLGGETSYKCCKAVNSTELRVVDEVAPAISLCADLNNKWIITKSGNLGNANTLTDILNYLVQHE